MVYLLIQHYFLVIVVVTKKLVFLCKVLFLAQSIEPPLVRAT